MSIRPKANRWYVRVRCSKTGKSVERTVDTKDIAMAIHKEIAKCFEEGVTWRDEESPTLLRLKKTHPAKFGTLRTAANLTLKYRYAGTPSEDGIKKVIWPVIEWFEDRGCLNIDDIKSEDLEAFIDWRREKENSASTINKYISLLRVINTVALKRDPPLCSKRLTMDRHKSTRIEKWWLRPEQLDELQKWLQINGEGLFADYITLICYQGFRPKEALRIEPRHLMGLNGNEPMIQVAGTKTKKSGNAIPVFDMAVPIFKRRIETAESHGWKLIFEPLTMRRARELWNDCREYLDVGDLSTATLRALRRTFGAYATAKGMPTKTLQEIFRHETITTTEGYLDLIGNNRVEDARKFMRVERAAEPPQPREEPQGNLLAQAIAAFRATGASPEEVAVFAKELMK